MLPFNFHHLYYFFTVAREGAVSEAARKLQITQPTLSAQLKQFENDLGIMLFNREGKNLVLTDKGHVVYKYADNIFQTGKELNDLLKDGLAGTRRYVYVGFSHFVNKETAASLFEKMLSKDPNLYVCVKQDRLSALMDDLNDHALDFIIADMAHKDLRQNGILNHALGKLPVHLCGTKTLAQKIKRIPEDLGKVPWILPAFPSPIFFAFQERFKKWGMNPKMVGEVEDPDMIGKMLMRGLGISAMNVHGVEGLKRHGVVQIGGNTGVYEEIYLISKKRRKPHSILKEAVRFQF